MRRQRTHVPPYSRVPTRMSIRNVDLGTKIQGISEKERRWGIWLDRATSVGKRETKRWRKKRDVKRGVSPGVLCPGQNGARASFRL